MAYGNKKNNKGNAFLPISRGLWVTDDFPFGVWSSGQSKTMGSTETRGDSGPKTAAVRLQVGTEQGTYDCRSAKIYTERASIVQDLTNTDSFITLSKFSKNPAALTVNDASIGIINGVTSFTAFDADFL